MAKYIRTMAEVNAFLGKVYELLETEDDWEINNRPWANGKVNKTYKYMTENGIQHNIVKNVIKELTVKNYSSTKDDYNPNFPNEQVWEFGITKNLIDKNEDFYVKLKIRRFEDELLLVMSFHPECPMRPEDKLTFPYADYTE